MSKVGKYFLDLQDQAQELGFDTVEEAFGKGYEVIKGKLVKTKDEQTEAHEAWLKRKDVVVGDLRNLLLIMHAAGKSDTTEYNIISNALTFILDGEQ